MKITVAPHLPLFYDGGSDIVSLVADRLPDYVEWLVPDDWNDMVIEMIPFQAVGLFERLRLRYNSGDMRQAPYLKILPDILSGCSPEDNLRCRELLLGLSRIGDSRIYAGTTSDTTELQVHVNRHDPWVNIVHFQIGSDRTLYDYIESVGPRLVQLKHEPQEKTLGGKVVSAFTAYSDPAYAACLLKRAFEEHNGDVDDRTYLYTYDERNKTFVEFRPSRNNTYHGMDIPYDTAVDKARDIVKLYNLL